MLELSQIWSVVSPSGCLLDLFDMSPSVFERFLAVWHKLYQEHIPSLPQTCVFPRSLVSSSGKWYLEQGLDTKGTCCCWASRPFCWTQVGNTYFQFIHIVPNQIHHHRFFYLLPSQLHLWFPTVCVFCICRRSVLFMTTLWVGHNVFNLFICLQMDEYWNAGC